MRGAVLLIVLASCAAEPTSELFIEARPLDAPPRGLAWRTDGETALAGARASGRGALVYFSAPWSEACERMERETMAEPRVRGLWTRLVMVKSNIDIASQRDLCATYQPPDDLPSFALFAPDGTLAARWSGVEGSDAFRDRVDRILRAASVPGTWRVRWKAAVTALAEGDNKLARELIADLDRAGQRTLAARLALAECRQNFLHYRWAATVESADLYLGRFGELPDATVATDLRGRALLRGTGVQEPALDTRVALLIDRFDEAAPLFGNEGTRRAWRARRTEASHRLVSIGEPAAAALLDAVVRRQADTSKQSARCLGRIRYSRVMPDLIDALRNKNNRYPVRARAILAMENWADPAFIEPLIEVLKNPREAAVVRVAAASAVARLGASHGGLYGSLVVQPILDALEARNVDLRRWTLVSLRLVRDPYDLTLLYDAMSDRRTTEDGAVRISDLACALFVDRGGLRIADRDGERVGADGHFPRGTGTALRRWWDANAHNLRWEPRQLRYVAPR
ncbi:MAG: HEAT repeat domain-containing protein [Planctomycetota bacterium]|jgi:hypothetical protein